MWSCPTRTAKAVRIKKKEYSVRNFWDNIKHNNIHITGVQEKENRERDRKPITGNNG